MICLVCCHSFFICIFFFTVIGKPLEPEARRYTKCPNQSVNEDSPRRVVHPNFLPMVFYWSARRPNGGPHGLRLHHDATAHTAAATLDYLEANYVQPVAKTPSSPGLALVISKAAAEGEGADARAFFKGVISDMPQSTSSGTMVT